MSRAGLLRLLAGIGGGVLTLGLMASPERIWPNFLIAAIYLTHLSLAALFFVAVQYATKAGWAVVLRRIPEAMTSSLVWSCLLMLMLVFGVHNLYEWSHEHVIASDAILRGKTPWLNVPFFFLRIVIYFSLWIAFAWFLVRNSRAQDSDGEGARNFSNIRIASGFLVVFALTMSFSGFDWLMSIEPHWFSTMFGVYVFSGCFQVGVASIIIFAIYLRRRGEFRAEKFPGLHAHGTDLVTPHHYHDLGKLLFAFSCFWAYIWFCQYMLIWYSNIPEETGYFIKRRAEGWDAFFFINLILNWIVPFFVLMSRRSKQNEMRLLLVAITVAIGHWFDLYIMIMPAFSPEPVLSLWEVGPMLGAMSLFALATLDSFRSAPAVPVKDPLLPESLAHH